jgi:uncharacterized protein YxjI
MSQQALVPIPSATLARGPFSHNRYVIKRPFWTLFGRTFRVYDPSGNQVLFVRHPMRWRDAVKFYTDDTERQVLLFVESRKALAIKQTYDITSAEGESLGLLRSRGFKSITRDAWDLLDSAEQPIGLLQEDGAALLRRFFPLMRGRWHMELAGTPVAYVKQVFRLFVKEFVVELPGGVDTRLALAAALLALMAEISRESRN